MIACKISQQSVEDCFPEVRKSIISRKGKKSFIIDYKLTRYACYLIVMNGVPRKEVIALGQTSSVLRKPRQRCAAKGRTRPKKRTPRTTKWELSLEKQSNAQEARCPKNFPHPRRVSHNSNPSSEKNKINQFFLFSSHQIQKECQMQGFCCKIRHI